MYTIQSVRGDVFVLDPTRCSMEQGVPGTQISAGKLSIILTGERSSVRFLARGECLGLGPKQLLVVTRSGEVRTANYDSFSIPMPGHRKPGPSATRKLFMRMWGGIMDLIHDEHPDLTREIGNVAVGVRG